VVILASPDDESPALFGEEVLRSLYRVYDLENEVISIAFTDFNATNIRSIKPIPAQGGVSAMNLSSVRDAGSEGGTDGSKTSGTSGSGHITVLGSILGLGIIMINL